MSLVVTTPAKRTKVVPMPKKKGPWKKKQRAVVTFPIGRALPYRLRNYMRYADTVSVTLTAGAGDTFFSCNGLYDPWVSGGGHQPMYFDELAALYDHFNVLSSRIEVQPIVSSVSTVIAVTIEDDTTGQGTLLSIEEGDAQYKCYPPVDAGGSYPLVKQKWSQVREFGSGAMQGAQLTGTSAANPTEQSFFHINVSDPAGGSVTVILQVLIVYFTEWVETKSNAGS